MYRASCVCAWAEHIAIRDLYIALSPSKIIEGGGYAYHPTLCPPPSIIFVSINYLKFNTADIGENKMIGGTIWWLLLLVLIESASPTHFRGGIIMARPNQGGTPYEVSDFHYQVMIFNLN
jgi:hypothetical protein